MRVLISGDRNWDDKLTMAEYLGRLPFDTIIIHGAAPGADSMADSIAEGLGMERFPFPAQWAKFGKSAGPIRNREMLKEGKPDLVVGFHDDIENSKGTADMLCAAEDAGVEYGLVVKGGLK